MHQTLPPPGILASQTDKPSGRPDGDTIAWINRWPRPEKAHACRDFDLCWLGARATAKDLGHTLEAVHFNPTLPAAELHRLLHRRGTRSILLPPQPQGLSWEGFPWENYSVVQIGHTQSTPNSHLVASNQIENTLECVSRIQAMGYERLGFVTRQQARSKTAVHFQAGFLMARQLMPDLVCIPSFSADDAPSTIRAAQLQTWLDAHRPDAILTNVPGLQKDLKRMHARVPDDIAIAVTNILTDGADTGIHQHPLEIGRTAMELLHAIISSNDRIPHDPPVETFVRGSWLDGRSMPPRRIIPGETVHSPRG